MKRAQISVFVIIGLVLVIIVGFVLVRVAYRPPNFDPKSGGIEVVREHIETCLKKSTVESLEKLGDQGMIKPDVSLSSKDAKISIFYFKGEDLFPMKEDIETQVANYVREDVAFCIHSFSNPEFSLQPGEINALSVIFNGKKATVKMEMPTSIETGGQDFNIETFEVTVKVNFADIYELSKQIHKDTIENPEWVNLEWLSSQDYEIRLVRVDSSTLIYEIMDDRYGLENQPYRYRFAVQYDL